MGEMSNVDWLKKGIYYWVIDGKLQIPEGRGAKMGDFTLSPPKPEGKAKPQFEISDTKFFYTKTPQLCQRSGQ